MNNLNKNYWENRYLNQEIAWDIGHISPPLEVYFRQMTDKSLKILIPGCGNAYEAAYLWHHGFKNVYLLDWSNTALQNFKRNLPDFPNEQLINIDFFEYNVAEDEAYDLVIEQTFFCAINPHFRSKYVEKMSHLLKKGGKLVGLLFNIPLNLGGHEPPFGGNERMYQRLFEPYFDIKAMSVCSNSLRPRAGNELFVKMISI